MLAIRRPMCERAHTWKTIKLRERRAKHPIFFSTTFVNCTYIRICFIASFSSTSCPVYEFFSFLYSVQRAANIARIRASEEEKKKGRTEKNGEFITQYDDFIEPYRYTLFLSQQKNTMPNIIMNIFSPFFSRRPYCSCLTNCYDVHIRLYRYVCTDAVHAELNPRVRTRLPGARQCELADVRGMRETRVFAHWTRDFMRKMRELSRTCCRTDPRPSAPDISARAMISS